MSFANLPARAALLPLRLVIGFGFLAHGLAKWERGPEKFGALLEHIGVPFPSLMGWVGTITELAGGVALLAGVCVAIACIPLIGMMLVAMFTIHIHYGFSAVNTIGLTAAGPQFGPPGYEISLVYIAALIALALAGPTIFSVDEWIARHRERD
jgi:putative oxidoreductase